MYSETRAETIEQAAKAFIALVRSKHPGEELYVPELRALDDALNLPTN